MRIGPFDPEKLVHAASTARGCELWPLAPFQEAELEEPLTLLTHDLNTSATLTHRGQELTERYLLRLLMVRRQVDAWAAGSAREGAPIGEPLFVVGAPRTGTTVVHRLASTVPGLRAPQGWELLYPLPPPEVNGSGTDSRLDWAGIELTAPQQASAEIASIHAYSARMPKECLSAMAFALRSEEFISRYEVPRYRAWLGTADMAPAYAIHRQVLLALQDRRPTERWILKSPVHLQNLPTLLATYPDARFVITHRDPLAMLSSVSSLVTAMRSAFSSAIDPVAIGRYHLELYSRSLDDLLDTLDSRLIAPDRVVHLRHADVLGDPVGETSRALTALGVPHEAIAAAHLGEMASEARSDAPGSHHHDPRDFGLDGGEVSERFGRYIERFLGPERA